MHSITGKLIIWVPLSVFIVTFLSLVTYHLISEQNAQNEYEIQVQSDLDSLRITLAMLLRYSDEELIRQIGNDLVRRELIEGIRLRDGANQVFFESSAESISFDYWVEEFSIVSSGQEIGFAEVSYLSSSFYVHQRMVQSLKESIGIAIGVSMIVFFFLLMFLNRMFLAPLQRFSGWIDDLKKTDHPLNDGIAHPKELRRLAVQFQSMTQRTKELKKHQEQAETQIYHQAKQLHWTNGELKEKTKSLSVANSELLQATRELHEAQLKVEKANQITIDFMQTIGHELRTPMNGIIGMSTLLEQTLLNEEQREYLSLLQNGVHNLMHVISQFVEFSELYSNDTEVRSIPMEIEQTISSIVQNLQPSIKEKRIDIQSLQEPPFPKVLLGDEGKIKQVLFSLFNNAIQTCRSGGRIESRLRWTPITAGSGELLICISDNGPGIPKEQLNHVFDPLESFGKKGSPSLLFRKGFGLVLAKELTERMGGRIWVRSQPGEGASFFVRLSMEIPQLTDEIERPASDEKTPSKILGPTAPQEVKKREKILLVEDDFVNQKVIKLQLQSIGLDSIVYEDGKAAVERYQEEGAAAILMDVQLPVLNGWEATRMIRKMEEETGYHVPIIAITAHASNRDEDECYAAGMDEYLTKPIKNETLFRVLAKYLSIDVQTYQKEGETNGTHTNANKEGWR